MVKRKRKIYTITLTPEVKEKIQKASTMVGKNMSLFIEKYSEIAANSILKNGEYIVEEDNELTIKVKRIANENLEEIQGTRQ